MNNQLALDLYNRICQSLLDDQWAEDNGFDPKWLKDQTSSAAFMYNVMSLVEKNDYSCQSVFAICQYIINSTSGLSLSEDFLHIVYQYTLNLTFPHAVSTKPDPDLMPACRLFLRILREVSEFQKDSGDTSWQSKYPLDFLTEDEILQLENPDEYRRFSNVFKRDYVYELMKLNQDVLGFNTLDHICGVHHVAVFIARQLQRAGLPIDLGRVSGAASGHDIGKYGCRKAEVKRVPYLHYYYTDLWFKRHDIPYIGHIAINHSTWDLELENLSLESLILIYADFRVKNNSDLEVPGMFIYSLEDSFEVILQKLDNVDAAKEKRYKRVYAKLKDFENYMVHVGVNVDIDMNLDTALLQVEKQTNIKHHYALMHSQDIIRNLKYLSINHNINLMHQLRDESSLNAILELARSGNDWKELREYIRIFEEYSTYMTQKQKLITIKFLFEKLTHPEDDIRRHCSELIGYLIAQFDEDYRKEVPSNAQLDKPEITSVELLDKYIRISLVPDHKIIPVHRAWIGYGISSMVSSVFAHCRKNQIGEYTELLTRYYNDESLISEESRLYMLETIKFIPLCSNSDTSRKIGTSNTNGNSTHPEDTVRILLNYIKTMLTDPSDVLRVCALEDIRYMLVSGNKNKLIVNDLRHHFERDADIRRLPAENLLRLKISNLLDMNISVVQKYQQYYSEDYKNITEIYLKNLKTATDWVIKKSQVDLLLEHAIQNPQENGFYTSMHFANLLKVSASESVRNRAGEAILKLAPYLSMPQRNEVAVEFFRALEMHGNQFAEYIPYYMGQFMMFLPPGELDELLDDLIGKTKHSSPQIISLVFKTIGIAIANYPKYNENFSEPAGVYEKRLVKMLSIILNGLADYNLQAKQVAFSVLGKEIFNSKKLDLDFKNKIFRMTAKKILVLLTDTKKEELLFLTNSAGLNHIYRFISDYLFFKGELDLSIPDKVAFFPGTFDPFSLSHKEIVKAIRDLGFEVYLAVDEFSWSKRTLPNLLRRNIINMSVADELNVYLYPEDYPINLSNSDNLQTLKNSFDGIEVYIVVGSDVILNASSYNSQADDSPIHEFPHVVFERRDSNIPQTIEKPLDEVLKKIKNKTIKLALAPEFEDISSTLIRNYIDENRDISMLIDPLAQKYIYEHGFYQREPQYKVLLEPVSVNIEVLEDFGTSLVDELIGLMYDKHPDFEQVLNEFLDKPARRFTIIRDTNQNNRILGFSAFHRIYSGLLYDEFKDVNTTKYIRNNASGKLLVIDGVFALSTRELPNIEQILLTETLTFCVTRDYDYAIYKNMVGITPMPSLLETMELMGFQTIPTEAGAPPVLGVKTSSPSTLNMDVDTMIKEPFRSSKPVQNAINKTRKKLQKAISMLYPGNLVLPFDRDIMYETLIKKICKENNVPPNIIEPKELGPALCVPYGAILNKSIVPNTVTKALHTEKFFYPDMKDYTIGPYPYYLDLETQVKLIASFNRHVILVDDILDKGYRIKVLDTLLKKENVKVQKIIVGFLTGRGKELMDIQKREVEGAYFIPKLKEWFNENDLYPFIGGDALWRGVRPEKNILPSINLVLPYTSPTMIKGAQNKDIYNLSEVVLQNALEILTTLEDEYQAMHERKLTLQHLGHILTVPRCPDLGNDVKYDFNLSPTVYLKNDIELLSRLSYIVNRQ